MVIAVIYIFFISCNILSLAENCFQKILSCSQKFHSLFSITLPLIAHLPFLLSPPAERGGEKPVSVKIRVFQKFFKWHLCNYENYLWSKICSFFFHLNLTLLTGVFTPDTPQNGPDWVLNEKKQLLSSDKVGNNKYPEDETWHPESIDGWSYYRLCENF